MGESVSFSCVPELQNNIISILMSQQSLAMVKSLAAVVGESLS